MNNTVMLLVAGCVLGMFLVPTISACPCPRIFDPVCANNGKDYSNYCVFNCKKKKDPTLQVLHHGLCTGTETEVDLRKNGANPTLYERPKNYYHRHRHTSTTTSTTESTESTTLDETQTQR